MDYLDILVDPSYLNSIYGGLMSLFNKKDSAATAAKRQYDYQRLLNQQQYDLTQQGYLESPTNQRLGLEAAGYNPILALGGGGMSYGSYSAGSASAPMDSTTSDLGNMATNAYQTFKLARDKNNADIASIMAGIKNTNADTALKDQYAMTEEAKRIQMDFQNAQLEAETMLKRKDLSTYDRKFYQFIAESASRIERNSVMNAVNQMDAQTNAQNAQTNAYNSETDRMNAETNRYNAHNNVVKSVAAGAIAGLGLSRGRGALSSLKALPKGAKAIKALGKSGYVSSGAKYFTTLH